MIRQDLKRQMLENIQQNGFCNDDNLLTMLKEQYGIPADWVINEAAIKEDNFDCLIGVDIINLSKDLEVNGSNKGLLDQYEKCFYGEVMSKVNMFADNVNEFEEVSGLAAELEQERSLVPYSSDSSSENEVDMEIEVKVNPKRLKRILSPAVDLDNNKKSKFCGAFIVKESEVDDPDSPGEEVEIQKIEAEEKELAKDFIDDGDGDDDNDADDEYYGLGRNLYRIFENSRMSFQEEEVLEKTNLEEVGGGLNYDDNLKIAEVEDLELQNTLNEVILEGKSREHEVFELDELKLKLNDKQISRFAAGIRRQLVESRDQDGNCAYYSIINSLHYLSTGNVRRFTDENNAEIGVEGVLETLKKYKAKLRYCKSTIAIKYLEELNNDLQSNGVSINLFKLNKRSRYLYSNWSKTEARLKSHTVKKIPVSLVDTLILGTDRLRTFEEIRMSTNKGRIVNLVAVPKEGSNEIDVTFIKDVSELVKVVSVRKNNQKIINRSFICDQCMTVQSKKEVFINHIEYCTGPHTFRYKFDRNAITCFSDTPKQLPQPFTVYYDLETTAGQEDPMKTISYAYALCF